jgi:hypothetical protein
MPKTKQVENRRMRLLEMGSRSYFSVWSTGNSLAIASRCFFPVWSTEMLSRGCFRLVAFFVRLINGKKIILTDFFFLSLKRKFNPVKLLKRFPFFSVWPTGKIRARAHFQQPQSELQYYSRYSRFSRACGPSEMQKNLNIDDGQAFIVSSVSWVKNWKKQSKHGRSILASRNSTL